MVSGLGVVLAAAAGMAFSMLFYSRMFFGDMWMKFEGFSKAQINQMKKRNVQGIILAAFISTLVMAYVLGVFVSGASYLQGIVVAFWLWLGFIGTTTFGGVLSLERIATV